MKIKGKEFRMIEDHVAQLPDRSEQVMAPSHSFERNISSSEFSIDKQHTLCIQLELRGYWWSPSTAAKTVVKRDMRGDWTRVGDNTKHQHHGHCLLDLCMYS